MTISKKFVITALSLMVAGVSQPVLATTVVVPGNSDPYLAGAPDGTPCCSGDSAPTQSPVLAPISLTGGQVLTFAATGGVNYAGGTPDSSADGYNDGTSLTYIINMTADYGTGISGAKGVNVDGLAGVFLTNSTPSGAAPAALDFSSGLNFTSLAPGVGQIFWIGDGLTGFGTGSVQQFTVPTGATRLFLGTIDAYGWYNNSGAINVTINSASAAVPEPASWALMLTGLGFAGYAMRRRASRTTRSVTFARG